jgi:hypothetical protein
LDVINNSPNTGRRVIAIYIAATVIFTALALAFWATGFTARHANLMRFVLYDPAPPFGDLMAFDYYKTWRTMGAGIMQRPKTPFNYSPFAFFVGLFFVNTPQPIATMVEVMTISVLTMAVVLARAIAASRIALLALFTALGTSYPFAFLFDRGNIEGTLWIPSVIGVYFFVRRRYLTAALFFALAASIKPFPAALFFLLLYRKRYREFLIGVLVVIAGALSVLAVIGPTFGTAFREYLRGFEIVTNLWVLGYSSPATDHSVFATAKFVVRVMNGWPNPEVLKGKFHTLYICYQLLSVLVFSGCVYRLRALPTLNQVFGIATLIVLISPVNYDYTLIGIYIPWSMLLFALSRPVVLIRFRPALILMVSCSELFTSQYYLLFGATTSPAGSLKMLLLLGLLIVSLLCPLPASFDVQETV